VTEHRLPFQAQAESLRGQRQWLFDLDHLLELEQQPKPTRQSVSQAVDLYLKSLLDQVKISGTDEDKETASQINQIFRNLWWGLFTCYEVEGLPRTNNDLEQFIRRMKMGQRRISGRKNVHDFILRYGSFAAFVDHAESEDDLLIRLAQVSQADFLKERNTMNMIVVKEQKVHRFRFHREAFLADLENRWEMTVASTGL
jgi:hypothetical protein